MIFISLVVRSGSFGPVFAVDNSTTVHWVSQDRVFVVQLGCIDHIWPVNTSAGLSS